MAWAQSSFSGGDGSINNPYKIATANDWNQLAADVNSGTTYAGVYFKQTDAIYRVGAMIGNSEEHSFQGTYDGDGKLIYVSLANDANQYMAPFRYVNGATLKRVHMAKGGIEGSIFAQNKFPGGLVGHSMGNTTILNCRVTTTIQSVEFNGEFCCGGFVGCVAGGTLTISNCIYDGNLYGPNATHNGGFIGWVAGDNDAHAYISNCLFYPNEVTLSSTGSYTFAHSQYDTNCTIDNCYYISSFGTIQGADASGMDAYQQVDALGTGWHVVSVGSNVGPYYAYPNTSGNLITLGTVTGLQTSYTHTGYVIDLDYTVYNVNGGLLTEGRHYTEEIRNNDGEIVTDVMDYGGYTLTLIGLDPYFGTKTLSFYVGNVIDLATLTADYTAQNGDILTGMLQNNVMISIAAGAVVTLSGATINRPTNNTNQYSGITCLGNASIILDNGTLNNIAGYNANYPAIYVSEGSTLTIHGTGSLVATSYANGSGIGGGLNLPCGNIVISGGNITATGHGGGAAIGGGQNASCGNITITSGITNLTVTKGENAASSIGGGDSSSMIGTVTVGCALSNGHPVGGQEGEIAESPFVTWPHTISFVANGGSGSMDDMQVLYNIPSPLNANTFYNGDNLFVGWNTAADGSGDFYADQYHVSNLTTTPNATVTLYAQWFATSGDMNDPHLIYTTADWNTFAGLVDGGNNFSGKYFKLMDNISVTEMVGNSTEHTFDGTFDGNHKTLNFTCTTDEDYCGPFRYTNGATIHDLYVTGTITTSGRFAGGLVGHNGTATLTINNVKSSINISSSYNGEARHGGFVGYSNNSAFTGCTFDGTLNGTASTNKYVCGFLGMIDPDGVPGSTAIFDDCLYHPTGGGNNLSLPYPFTPGDYDENPFTLNNCFYYVSTDYLTSDVIMGILHLNQGKRLGLLVPDGEDLGTITVELASAATASYDVGGFTIHETGFEYGGNLFGIYSETVSVNLEFLGEIPAHRALDYYLRLNEGSPIIGSSNPYILTMPDDDPPASHILISIRFPWIWEGSGTNEDPYQIHVVEQWNLIGTNVNYHNDTYNGVFFKLMDDIHLIVGGGGGLDDLIGLSEEKSFQGTFDGNGYTITMTGSNSSVGLAPFRYIKNATIKNLHTDGSVSSTSITPQHGSMAAGIISQAYGNCSLINSRSSLEILNGVGYHGGLVAAVYSCDGNLATMTIEGCSFDGKINYNGRVDIPPHDCGGFVGNANGNNVYINNCVFNPSEIIDGMGLATFVVSSDQSRCHYNNAYYFTSYGTAQGKQALSITNDEHVTVEMNGVATTYPVGGITAYKIGNNDNKGLVYTVNETTTIYAGLQDEVSLNLGTDVVYTSSSFYVNDGTLSGTANPYTLAMPDQDVIISAILGVADWATQSDGDSWETAYLIYTKDQLDLLASRVNDGTGANGYSGKYFMLMDDITYTYTGENNENNYTAIGNLGHYFKGHFDGNNKTVSGIRIFKYGSEWYDFYQGLFGYVGNGGEVKNLTLDDASIAGYNHTGGIVGSFQGIAITNCRVTSSVTIRGVYAYNVSYHGGIVGYVASGTVSRCISAATLTSENGGTGDGYGGIAGYVSNDGFLSDNLAVGVTVPSCYDYKHGAIVGVKSNYATLERNYYANCTVGSLSVTPTGVGCNNADETYREGAVPGNVRTVIGYDLGEGKSVFIASPVTESLAPSSVTGLLGTQISTNPVLYNFDFYRFDQSEEYEWRNYLQHNFQIENGQGYLYAKQSDVALTFNGTFNLNEEEALGLVYDESASFKGYNLVGNPFPRAAFVDMPFYKMNDSGTGLEAVSAYQTVAISPCTGIMVQATEPEQSVTFRIKGLEQQNAVNNGSLHIALAQADQTRDASTGLATVLLDNAIVSFNEGELLGKFYFGENKANIYLPQGNDEYAIVFSDRVGEKPLNFKANESGIYTLNIEFENVDKNYLHLIDNLTGADVDLLVNPSYTFKAKTTDYESRFRLVFVAGNEDSASTDSASFAFYSNGNWIISNDGEATLQVIDLNGRILSSEHVNGCVSKSIHATTGIYMLRLVDGDSVKVQKIVVR